MVNKNEGNQYYIKPPGYYDELPPEEMIRLRPADLERVEKIQSSLDQF